MNDLVKIPALGENIEECTIGTWYKKVGDQISQDDVLVAIDTDKASFELTSEHDGFLAIINSKEGDVVPIGSTIAEVSKSPYTPLVKNTEIDKPTKNATSKNILKKIFISHSSKDGEIVEEIIDLLEVIGLESDNIFCSSFNGYGISLGENFLERLKDELNSEVLVLFVLSENFYKSPICLCEMGAAWVQTKQHIPIIIPPFDFNSIKGVIPLTQGFKISDSLALNLFKEKIEYLFQVRGIQNLSSWERKRNKIVSSIISKLPK